MTAPNAPLNGAIVFFDGTCLLCNRFANLLLKRVQDGSLRVATLQGATAAALFKVDTKVPVNSIVFWENGRVLSRSDAVLEIAPRLGGVFRLAPAFRIVPRVVRDVVYDLVARYRFRWFGQSVCRVPAANEVDAFLP
jgi:predicted DCC family thiol-disulfide oxidoreductase YuxK